jgi:hypothetical protein
LFVGLSSCEPDSEPRRAPLATLGWGVAWREPVSEGRRERGVIPPGCWVAEREPDSEGRLKPAGMPTDGSGAELLSSESDWCRGTPKADPVAMLAAGLEAAAGSWVRSPDSDSRRAPKSPAPLQLFRFLRSSGTDPEMMESMTEATEATKAASAACALVVTGTVEWEVTRPMPPETLSPAESRSDTTTDLSSASATARWLTVWYPLVCGRSRKRGVSGHHVIMGTVYSRSKSMSSV